jgi:hypothetical protein
MKEAVIVLIFSLVPIAIFSLSAYLIYKNVSGWGWFLLAVVIVVGNSKFSYKPDAVEPGGRAEKCGD